MITLILDDVDTESSAIPDCVTLETIERIAAEQAAALRPLTGETEEAAVTETTGQTIHLEVKS